MHIAKGNVVGNTVELLEAMASCDRGEAVGVEEVLAALPPRS
jgi:hypothetical protein